MRILKTTAMQGKVGSLLCASLLLGLASTTVHASKATGVLEWAMEQEVPIADPYYAQSRAVVILTDEVCDSPLHRNLKTGEYEPHLATSYKWVDDVTLEMEFRKDVVFHSGKPFSAKDVKYTFDHILAPDSGVITASNFNFVKSVEMLEPYKARFHLHKPFPMALEYLSNATPILPAGHYDNAPVQQGRKAYGSVPLDCTGPYKLVSVKPGQSMDLEANKNYFGGGKGKPSIEKLHFRTIIDPDAQLVQLLGGELDWIWDLRLERANELKAMKQVQVVSSPIQRFSFMNMDASGKFAKNPFQDIKVRQAVNHAINRESIAKNLISGGSEALSAACHPNQFGCFTDVHNYEYDPQKARKLLAEAGFPDGFTTDMYAYREKELAEAIINDLRKVGIKANLRFMQYNALRPLLRSGEAAFAYLSWGSFGLADASASTSYFFGGGPDDLSRDPEVQALLKTADTSVDPNVRKDSYKKALELIADRAYWAPLFTLVRYYAFSKDLDSKAYFDDLPRFYAAKWK
jgi:peptide/nickel transport system substrate-binding protein